VEEDAPKKSFLQAAWAGICLILKSTWSVFRIRSFQIILVAGIVGTIAAVNSGYKVMYFQVRLIWQLLIHWCWPGGIADVQDLSLRAVLHDSESV
jgi:hypothetical protein